MSKKKKKKGKKECYVLQEIQVPGFSVDPTVKAPITISNKSVHSILEPYPL
jgi:hypothetical protein